MLYRMQQRDTMKVIRGDKLITLYTYRQKRDNIIEDIDAEFNWMYSKGVLNINADDAAIMKAVDKAMYIGNGRINTPYDRGVLIKNLSTGCKTCILANHISDKIISIEQCEDNTMNILFSLDNRKYYSRFFNIDPNMRIKYPVKIGNKVCRDTFDILEELQ